MRVRQKKASEWLGEPSGGASILIRSVSTVGEKMDLEGNPCLLYTSDAADDC